jgi:tripartite-type tricarboxylate transporter receptor subunit TctC
MAEAGVADFEGSIWFGLYGPPGMPADLRSKINAAVGKAIMSDSFKKLMENSGSVAVAKNPADFEAYIRAEIGQLDKLVAAGAIQFK